MASRLGFGRSPIMLCRALLRRASATPHREYRGRAPHRAAATSAPAGGTAAASALCRPLPQRWSQSPRAASAAVTVSSRCVVVGQCSPLPLQHLLDSYQCSREDDHLSYGEMGMPVPPFGCAFSTGKLRHLRKDFFWAGVRAQLSATVLCAGLVVLIILHYLISEFLVLKWAGNRVLAPRCDVNLI